MTEPPTPPPGEDGAPEGDGNSLAVLTVRGELVRRVSFVTRATANLVLGVGQIEGEDRQTVFVPYLEIHVEGQRSSDEPETSHDLLAATVTIEDAAFMLANLATDFAESCRQVAALGAATTRPEAGRMEHAYDLTTIAASEVTAARDALGGLLDQLRR